jgi:hypothetical protein
MLATGEQLGEFLIGTSNQSEILRENAGIQFLSLRQDLSRAYPEKLLDFFDSDMLQLIDFELRPC